MAIPTMHFRHVWRHEPNGVGIQKVLVLQHWYKAEGWEHENIVANGGYWETIPIAASETPHGPTQLAGEPFVPPDSKSSS